MTRLSARARHPKNATYLVGIAQALPDGDNVQGAALRLHGQSLRDVHKGSVEGFGGDSACDPRPLHGKNQPNELSCKETRTTVLNRHADTLGLLEVSGRESPDTDE